MYRNQFKFKTILFYFSFYSKFGPLWFRMCIKRLSTPFTCDKFKIRLSQISNKTTVTSMSWLINVTSAVFTVRRSPMLTLNLCGEECGDRSEWRGAAQHDTTHTGPAYNEIIICIMKMRQTLSYSVTGAHTHAHIRHWKFSAAVAESSFLYLMRLALVFEHILLLWKIVKWEMRILPSPIIFSAHNTDCISVSVCCECECGGRKYYVMIIMHWRKSITTNRHFRRRRSHRHHHLCRRTVTVTI